MFQKTKLFIIWAMFFASIRSFIYRLPCISHASFVLTPSKYFMGVIKSTFYADSINDCGSYCVRSMDCVFANYNNDLTCQLMSSIPNSLNSTSNQQWTVLTTDYTNNKNIGPLCENNTPCESLYCRDVCSTDALLHTYQCLANLDVSRNAISSLSSTLFDDTLKYLIPKNAIDGSVTTFASSNPETTNWFKLDLNYVYQITQINIYNRVDCCSERMNDNILVVSVTDQYLDAAKVAILTADMHQNFAGLFIGRYIFVVGIPGKHLQLAEINVSV